MTPKHYDLIIIGGGSAGLTAAETAVVFGKKIALVAERIGGDCLWTGCVPSKAMISAAKIAQFKNLDLVASWELVKYRIARTIDTIVDEHDNAEFYKNLGIDVYEHRAKFLDPHTIEVAGEHLTAKKFLICTGARARVPDIKGLQTVPYLTNENLFELKELPASITIIGGGPIGCELGQSLQRLGVSVTIVQGKDRLMDKDEPAAAAVVLEALQKDGVKVILNASVVRVEKVDAGIFTVLNQNEKECIINSESLLLATGRQPNVEDLALEAAGVAFSSRGITHDKHLKTTTAHIYVAGDVAGDYQFTHYASAQAGTAVQNLLFPIFKATVTDTVPWCTFTSPEVAHTGLTVASANAGKIPHEVITFPLDHVDRALAEDKTTGFIQLLVGSKDRILGATIVCENAGDMIQELTLAITQKLTVEDLLKIIHVYPTYSSGIQQALFYRFLKSNAVLVRLGKFVAKYI